MEELTGSDFEEFEISPETREMLRNLVSADQKRKLIEKMRNSLINNV
jgi:hypothetical protein